MKQAIIRRIVLITAAALLLFMIASVIAVGQFNKQSAKDNALSQLNIFEKNIQDNGFSEDGDFSRLVKLTDGDLRITVISLEGVVIADTLSSNVSELENHAGRAEVITALNGGTGENIRKSESFGVNYLYLAKKVNTSKGAVILRVAVPVKNINTYIWPMVAAMAIIFAAVLIAVFLIAPRLTKSLITPINMIKAKLDTVGKEEDSEITLTPYDEVNSVLLEIDDLSTKLNTAIADFQSEKQKLDIILENIDQAIIAIDNQKRIISCNKAAEEYFCFEFSEPVVLEKAIRNKGVLDTVNRAAEKKEFTSYDHMRVNGEVYEVRYFPVGLKEISLIITAQNVTDLRKISAEKQDFFVNASHELNTPLSSILGYAEILKKEKKYKAEFVDTIYKQAFRMKNLIGDMLTLGELEEGKELADETVNLEEVATDILAAYKPKAESKEITLTAHTEAISMLANKEKIITVISNLIDNSIKYTGKGGSVLLTVKKQNGKTILSVKDTGYGIAQKHLSRLCERFYRTDTGRSKAEGGTGLGLAIVKHICNYYGATLTINSKENIGTEVIIIFP